MVGGHAHSKTRILVVEDEAIIARDLTLRLEGLGYEVTGTAATGQEALDLARSTSPTLVFMDIVIQGPMDGIETAQRLTSRMDVPIVFLTAHTDTGTIQRAKKARPYGYLIKPFDERELMTTIEMAVGRHRTDADARLLQQAMVAAGVGMILASAVGPVFAIQVCNAAFERLSGHKCEDIIGRSPSFLEGESTDPKTSEAFHEALRHQREFQATLRLHRSDGSAFWTSLVLSPVRNPFGETTHFLLCLSEALSGETDRPGLGDRAAES